MMLYILLLLSISSWLFVGLLVLNFLRLLKKFSILELLSLAYGLGIGCVAMQMFMYSRIGISFNFLAIIAPWCLLYAFRPFSLSPTIRLPKFGKIESVLLFSILLLSIFVGFEALVRPLVSWDGIATWLIKSKAFFIEGGVKPQTLIYLNDGYPLLMGLAGAFVYSTLGVVNDRLVLILFYGFYLAAGGVVYSQLRKLLNFRYSLFLTFLFLSTQNIIRHGGRYEAGYVDLAFGFYLLSAVVIFTRVLNEKKLNMFVLFMLFLGIIPLVKEEGVAFSIIMSFVVLYFVMKKSLPARFLYVLFLWILPFFDWRLYKFFYHIPTNYLFKNPQLIPDRFPITLQLIVKEFFNIKNWNLLWMSYIASLFLMARKREHFIISFVIIAMIISYIVAYLISPNDPANHVPNTIDRLLLHFAPLGMVSIGFALANLKIGVKTRVS